ncbi:MAG: ribonuclease J [Deltaproteobacteria bacterium]|nr:ribonuclease J [Deltaproteobacteria bacterium]
MDSSPLKIIPLGGVGEIGLNMTVFEAEDAIVVVDAGLMFPEDHMLGVDIVIPDFSYLRENRHKVAAVVLTHSHEDHIGALPFLLREVNVPVYATPFTLGMVKNKLEEKNVPRASLVPVAPRQKEKIGPFSLEFVRVCHSVADGVGLGIYTPQGLVVHTGDFKISHGVSGDHATDLARFARFGEEGVLALLSDSTNAEKEGYTLSEEGVGQVLEAVFDAACGRIIVALFASNIPRIARIVDMAKKRKSRLVISGRSLEFSVALAQEQGLLSIPRGMEIDLEAVDDYPDNKVVILTTGSQGEPMSALARIAAGTHKKIRVKKNDTYILSSKFIPGNEKAIAGIVNSLFSRGAEVIYEKISDIHVSGHAFREELKLMLQLTRPRYFMPIHGEYRHLVHHSRLARSQGIGPDRVLLAKNGDVVRFNGTGARISGSVETGRVLVDGKGVGDVGNSVLRERRALSEHGAVVVVLILDAETGVVMHGPRFTSQGFVFGIETGHLLDDAACVVLEVLEEVDMAAPDRVERITAKVRNALRSYFSFVIQRRPVILPVILEV